MKLFNKISPKASAFILLFSFLGIYMINIGCSIGNVVEDLNWFSQVDEKHDHGSHNHGDGHHHDHGTDNEGKSQEEEDDCCDDDASVFFASVQAAPIVQGEYSFSPIQVTILHKLAYKVLNINFSSDYFTDNQPPPDILSRFPNTRIFIQSFQI